MGQYEADVTILWSRSNNLQPEYKAKAGEGLSKLLAYLRVKEEQDKQEELRKLIPVGTEVFYWDSSEHFGRNHILVRR